jgi:hypothetical protein
MMLLRLALFLFIITVFQGFSVVEASTEIAQTVTTLDKGKTIQQSFNLPNAGRQFVIVR